MNDTQKYMERAIRLAGKGAGWVNPNPLVGAVVVKDNVIIGEGYHQYFGGPHAEVNAIAACTADPAGATLYVTLEPCTHTGKTPPCTQLILEKHIAKVIIGMSDPNPLVNGKGIELLRNSGVEVESGVLEHKIRRQNEVFIKYITTGMPFVVLKSAMTLDGKTASVTRASRWITGETSRKMVHRMRAQYSAVMTGINTVIQDDPLLNVRLKKKQSHQPLRIILDSTLKISREAKVIQTEPLLSVIATTHHADPEKIQMLERIGVHVIVCPEDNGQVSLEYLVKALGAMEIDSVMIEGGSTLAFSAIRTGIVDKLVTFIAPRILGGEKAPTPVGGAGIEHPDAAVELVDMEVKKAGKDLCVEAWIKK
ncbi:MAG TPA: bifunctional diaminohydroxyphosphoribosylaminopyrimidine deaminase/5-amino-6-(5-phosphoribosylamino)uracil reductase RibD [Bacteroidales bacterium]|nr:bifunctional diaminohydroxyphosphoribosylaminopyrimidine deaminase/5-amino-6-(5-phosphoribosylamino)uracil reductase RibD [Bacteroidales bacterium]HPS73653.1 bifunctional diaminohydroxyphosphoribosylaminopyrimidine deaminase/5-amino-6-(5-phosphoribosylamino)uracil reductase RibD [Bacteroidales bacterium]